MKFNTNICDQNQSFINVFWTPTVLGPYEYWKILWLFSIINKGDYGLWDELWDEMFVVGL
jgi:hypothetical protein